MNNPQRPTDAGCVERARELLCLLGMKHDRIHPSNRTPSLPLILKVTYADLTSLMGVLHACVQPRPRWVEQCDRDAAAEWARDCYPSKHAAGFANDIAEGRADGALVQAFAAHRRAAISASDMRAALEPFAREADGWDSGQNDGHEFSDSESIDMEHNKLNVGHLRAARSAIRALPLAKQEQS